MAALMEERFSPVICIITGGDASKLLPWLGKEWIYEPDLIFIGLAAVIQHHKG
jgi:pantothenate kinase type III